MLIRFSYCQCGCAYECTQLYCMNKSQKRHKTEQAIDRELDKMLFLAAEEKMLPKIIYEYSFQHRTPTIAHNYRQSVKEIYTKQTSRPIIYNEEQAKTHREKFRQKILKLVNNQLPIDYLKPMKSNGEYIMTYKGQPLERVQYPTKQQYKIFRDFNEAKFKQGYEDVFEDKLQYKFGKPFNPNKKQSLFRSKKKKNDQLSERKLKIDTTGSTTMPQVKGKQSTPMMSLPKLIARTQFDRAKLLSPSLTKKKHRKLKPINQQGQIMNVIRKIGGYSLKTTNDISITKQSIIKYFRQFYPRPFRIIDFLQFSDVQTVYSYAKIPQKLKLMPNEHIYFMAFLFYDSNNDGYICGNDIIRIQEMGKKCPLLLEDCEIMKSGATKLKYENKLNYKDLYRLPQVPQTTYFNWLKKQRLSTENPQTQSHNEQLKDYFDHLNRRKILIHYEGFKKLFQNQKPCLWYDTLWRISGIKYQNLKYE